MAAKKKAVATVRIEQDAGAANVAKIGQVLGAHGVNIVQVVRSFNELTAQFTGLRVPADVVIYDDRSSDVNIRTPTTASLLKRRIGTAKGSSNTGRVTAGKLSSNDIRSVAEVKLRDLNTPDVEAAMKIVAGTARSMGFEVEGR